MGNFGHHSSMTISVIPPQKEIFNFHKDYITESEAETMEYPSFIKKSESNCIGYSKRSSYNSRQYEIRYLNQSEQPTLIFTKMNNTAEQIWKNISPNEVVSLFEGCVIKLADTQFEIKKICRNFNELEGWEEMLKTVSDVNPLESINLNLISSRRMQQSRLLKHSIALQEKSIGRYNSISSFGVDQDQGQFCRYCYGRDSTSINPLLNLCKCSGSVKFSHYYCLKNWITSRSKTRASDCYEYFEYDLSCEVCKQKITKTAVHKGKKYIIYSDSLIHPPFVVMSYRNETSNKVRQYIINFDYSHSVLVGRGSTCDIQVNDRMISAEHCQLIFENNQLLLRNRNPTYGSFIQIENEWNFSNIDSQLEIMISNHLFRFKAGSSSCFGNNAIKLKIEANQEQ